MEDWVCYCEGAETNSIPNFLEDLWKDYRTAKLKKNSLLLQTQATLRRNF